MLKEYVILGIESSERDPATAVQKTSLSTQASNLFSPSSYPLTASHLIIHQRWAQVYPSEVLKSRKSRCCLRKGLQNVIQFETCSTLLCYTKLPALRHFQPSEFDASSSTKSLNSVLHAMPSPVPQFFCYLTRFLILLANISTHLINLYFFLVFLSLLQSHAQLSLFTNGWIPAVFKALA